MMVIDEQVERGVLGSRSAIADARLDYGLPHEYAWTPKRLLPESLRERNLPEITVSDKLVAQIARMLDPTCFRRYTDGECLPRGLETFPVAKVNEIQGFRQRHVESQARKVLLSLNLIQRPDKSSPGSRK
jgi:hypothetical protein